MTLRETIQLDFAANPRDAKARLILFMFRLAHTCRASPSRLVRILAVPYIAFYRGLTEFVLGVEIRPRTQIGPGLGLHHGVGIVLNDHAVLGRNVTLRQGVTIGHARAGGGCPVIGDNVEFGANSMVLGAVTVGANSSVGAGAIVTFDVPDGSTVRVAKPTITSRGEAREPRQES